MDILNLTQNYLEQNIVSQAAKIDRDWHQLKQALQDLGQLKILALKVPQSLGGSGISAQDYARFQILMARYSGALAFLQTQHQSAASMLAASKNKILQEQYLSYMKTGEKLVGVGFSHLRRPGQPMVKAVEVKDGYVISGEVPWITGLNFFDDFIIGATLSDGQELYGILPFDKQIKSSFGSIEFSDPLELIAMTATNTVTAKLDNWLLSKEQVLYIKPQDSIDQTSRKNVINHGFFALGCAHAALDILQKVYQKKQLDFIQQSWQLLQQEVINCEREIFEILDLSEADYKSKLKLRSQAVNLAQRCSQAAVIASSGAANYLNNVAGRVYREALLFSVSGQTIDVMEMTLKQLLDND
ncbi:MAG: acyl-CoA dehydrogenase family protein [Cyanobacteria bacterium P01_F01_bin.143]